MEKTAERVIEPSLKFDENFRTAMWNDFAEEEWLEWLNYYNISCIWTYSFDNLLVVDAVLC